MKEILIDGIELSISERNALKLFKNGNNLLDVVDKLQADGFTSPIKIVGYENLKSYVINKYEAYIIEEGKVIRMAGHDLWGLTKLIGSMKE